MITKFNFKMLGRGGKMDDDNAEVNDETTTKYIVGLGGKNNIKVIDNCITRLRLVVEDSNKIDEELLKAAGAIGVIKMGETGVQVIAGLGKVDKVAASLKEAV